MPQPSSASICQSSMVSTPSATAFRPQLARQVQAGFDHRALARLRMRAEHEALVDLEFGEGICDSCASEE